MQKIPTKTTYKYRSFSPRVGNFPKNLHLNNIYNIGNINQYYRIAEFGTNNSNSSNIFLYYSPKNININNARIGNIYSPIRKNLTLKKSSSQKSYTSIRPMSHNIRNDNSINGFSYTRNFNSNNKKKIHFTLEKEKLYQETYQIRKMVKFLNKKLSQIKMENLKRDSQINKRQKKINDIIINNNESTIVENNNNNISKINKKNGNLNIMNDISNFNDYSINSSINNNYDYFDEVPIFSNFNLHTNKNSATYNLLKKIKKAINQMNNFILIEKKKYDEIKKSLFLTKLNELNIETNLLEEQISKINTFIQRDIIVQEDNMKKKENFSNLQLNIERQEKIIKSLNERSNYLDKEEAKLKEQLNETKKLLESKEKKININKEKLNKLIQKNNTLSKDKEMNKPTLKIINNNNTMNSPQDLKTYYTGEISKLNKLIKFYSSQCDFAEKEIAKLKNQQIKENDINNINNNKQFIISSEFNNNLIKSNLPLTEKEKMTEMKKTLDIINAEKNKLKKKFEIYQEKLISLEKEKSKEENKEKEENEESDFYNKSQIEFGIDEKNPFFTEEREGGNPPLQTEKFTSAQFNQFTYILFKNFESKNISYEESKDKVFPLFDEFNKKNNLLNTNEINKEKKNNFYKSDKFNFIVEGYTKIILDILSRNNKYNFTMTKIFIKALFFNSDYDVNKFIEYFKVLFSYTRNHSHEEKNFIKKIKTEYKDLIEKLIACVKQYISNNKIKEKKYIDLLKMKGLLETNDINFDDEYIEFIFYYLKKFDDPKAKLGDLKISLLYDLIPDKDNGIENNENNEVNINTQDENNINNDINDIKIDINKNDKNINDELNELSNKKESIINEDNIESKEIKDNKEKEESKDNKENNDINNNNIMINENINDRNKEDIRNNLSNNLNNNFSNNIDISNKKDDVSDIININSNSNNDIKDNKDNNENKDIINKKEESIKLEEIKKEEEPIKKEESIKKEDSTKKESIKKEESIKLEEIKKEEEKDINNNNNKKEINFEEDKKIENIVEEMGTPDPKAIKKSVTEDNLTPKMQNMPSEFDDRREKNIDIDKENTDDMEEDEDSMTEITNEEYVKQILEAIKQMKEGLEKSKTNFNDLMNNVIQKRKINGKFYEYVTIEDFNEQMKSIKITLSDLKLSCLCSKYCIPNELRLVDKNKINNDIQKFIKGTLKLEEEENM